METNYVLIEKPKEIYFQSEEAHLQAPAHLKKNSEVLTYPCYTS